MKSYQYKAIWEDERRKEMDPWWCFIGVVKEFNEQWHDILVPSV